MGMAKVVVLWTDLEVEKSCFATFLLAVQKTLQSYGAFVDHKCSSLHCQIRCCLL